jgi:hypothetical protein
MTIVNGDLYACVWGDPFAFPIPNYIVKVNTEAPLYSQFIMELPIIWNVRAMTTFNYDCDSSTIYIINYNDTGTGYNFYEVNLEEPSLNYVANLEGITGIADFTNPTEHLRFDCVPSLDLDGTATAQLDYEAATVCTAPGSLAYPLAGAGPIITTNTIVDSIWVGITGGGLDGTDEQLGCTASAFGYAEASNGGVMLYNEGQATNAELMDWLRQSLFYQTPPRPAPANWPWSPTTRTTPATRHTYNCPCCRASAWKPPLKMPLAATTAASQSAT